MTQFQLAVGALLGVILGCSPVCENGKPINFPREKDATLFGVRSATQTTMSNRFGKLIDGLVLRDASLIQNTNELASSKHRQYVMFRGFLLGNMVSGRYWQQQSEKQGGLGLPVMDTRYSKVILVGVDSNQVVIECKSVRAAHVMISVDTNDFSRSFKP